MECLNVGRDSGGYFNNTVSSTQSFNPMIVKVLCRFLFTTSRITSGRE